MVLLPIIPGEKNKLVYKVKYILNSIDKNNSFEKLDEELTENDSEIIRKYAYNNGLKENKGWIDMPLLNNLSIHPLSTENTNYNYDMDYNGKLKEHVMSITFTLLTATIIALLIVLAG